VKTLRHRPVKRRHLHRQQHVPLLLLLLLMLLEVVLLQLLLQPLLLQVLVLDGVLLLKGVHRRRWVLGCPVGWGTVKIALYRDVGHTD
jgi:hypothetical protein